jgi:hypothetical protein
VIDGKQRIWTAFCRGMARPELKRRKDPVAQRLEQLRLALGYQTAAAFAGYLDISAQRWNNVEGGFPLSKDVAFKLVQKVPGLTLDWLYFGRADGLPVALARRLGELGPTGRKSSTS